MTQFEVAVWFSTGNVISFQYNYTPNHSGLHLLAVIETLIGMIINVAMFAIVAAKVQAPTADIVFSDSVIITTRNFKPVLMCRVGNKRCNLIFHPEFRVLLMRSTSTHEGEEYMRYDELTVTSPATMAGSTTLVHEITEESPLFGMTEDYVSSLTPSEFQLVVTVIGLDSRFQSDISAMKKYKPDNVCWNQLFSSVMKVDKHGTPFVDFHALSKTEPLKVSRRKSSTFTSEFGNNGLSAPDKEPIVSGNDPTQTVHLCYGGWHQHRDAPVLPMVSL